MALTHMNLRDFVIVQELDLGLESGFTALTGETGAGKSILIDALQLVLGARADSGLVREGASRTEVSAEFHCPPALLRWLDAAGFGLPDAAVEASVLLRRSGSGTLLFGSTFGGALLFGGLAITFRLAILLRLCRGGLGRGVLLGLGRSLGHLVLCLLGRQFLRRLFLQLLLVFQALLLELGLLGLFLRRQHRRCSGCGSGSRGLLAIGDRVLQARQRRRRGIGFLQQGIETVGFGEVLAGDRLFGTK